jgi:hypothetical protein
MVVGAAINETTIAAKSAMKKRIFVLLTDFVKVDDVQVFLM